MNPEDILYARAPGRVDLAGTGTDLPSYREEHGGHLLSVALRRYSFAMLVPRQDRRLLLRRLHDGAELEVEDVGELPTEAPLAAELALIRQAKPRRGFDLTLNTEIPPGSGLAVESSLAVAVYAILEEFEGRLIEKEALSHEVYHAGTSGPGIRAFLHEPYACALGGFTDVEFDGKTAVRQKFLVKESVRLTLETHSVLALRGEPQEPMLSYGEVCDSCTEEAEKVTRSQHRMKAVSQAARDALSAGDLRGFATFLDEEWLAYQDMNPLLVPEGTERIIRLGHEAGSRGGKVCGLFGRCLYFLCDDLSARNRVEAALKREGCTILPFQVDELGVETWRQPQPGSPPHRRSGRRGRRPRRLRRAIGQWPARCCGCRP
jgi:D-glycero-alpha-D-manno-heptose-7-phosphate kinase